MQSPNGWGLDVSPTSQACLHILYSKGGAPYLDKGIPELITIKFSLLKRMWAQHRN